MTQGKGKQVQAMFDNLAPRYDFMNRVMTGGQDQRWRRFVVDRASLEDGATVLDLACGTGDIAFEAKRRFPNSTVHAGDFSVKMIKYGKLRDKKQALNWTVCDAMDLPFEDNTFDAVTFGYLLRNVEKIDVALSEVMRVLKPGGRVVCLDTMPPPPGILRPFITAYLRYGLPVLGRILAGNSDAYDYLSSSTLGFETPEALKGYFDHAGFEATTWRTFMFSTIAVHWARKPS